MTSYYTAQDFDLNQFNNNEDYKRRLRSKINSFPKITFTIYLLLLITNIIVMGFLLSNNDNSDDDLLHFVIIWGMYIISLIINLCVAIFMFLSIPLKKWILVMMVIFSGVLSGLSLFLCQYYGHIASSDILYYFISHVINISTCLFSFVPIYLVYA